MRYGYHVICKANIDKIYNSVSCKLVSAKPANCLLLHNLCKKFLSLMGLLLLRIDALYGIKKVEVTLRFMLVVGDRADGEV